MANKDAAFGMKPVRMIGGAPYTGGQSRYRIAANYGTSIFQGDMVAQVTGGTVEVHADGGTVPVVGVFNGVQYTDPTSGEQVFSTTTLQAPTLQTSLLLSLMILMLCTKCRLTTRSQLPTCLATLILSTPHRVAHSLVFQVLSWT
jgi:hypothetical protein